MLVRVGAIAIGAGMAAGCVSMEGGTPTIDLRGCQSVAKAKDPPPLNDGPVTMEIRGTKIPIVSALAWAMQDEEAVHVVLSTGVLGCDDLRLSARGVAVFGHNSDIAHLTLAPVMIDERIDQRDISHSVIPSGETWRVVTLQASFMGPKDDRRPAFFSTQSPSAADPARGAATKGRRQKVRVAFEAGGDRLSGALDIEGCGEIERSRARRPQSGLDFRIGDRRPTIRGATYRKTADGGDYDLRLTSAAADCDGADRGDVDVTLSLQRVVTQGEAFSTAYNYASHGITVTNTPLDGGSGDDRSAPHVRLFVSGVLKRPMHPESEPRGDLESRSYERHFHLRGEVDALSCPPQK